MAELLDYIVYKNTFHGDSNTFIRVCTPFYSLWVGKCHSKVDKVIAFEPSVSNDLHSEADHGEDPVNFFIKFAPETRFNVRLDHSSVFEFVYFNRDSITKAFLPKRVINWRIDRKSIATVLGTPVDFTLFSVQELDLGTDKLLLYEQVKLCQDVSQVSVSKFIKNNRKNLTKLPSCVSTDSKVKNLFVVAFLSSSPSS